MVKLSPCPFCGNTECYVCEHPESVWDFVVTCDDCGTSGPIAGWGYPSAWETKEIAHAKAIELWNNRAPFTQEQLRDIRSLDGAGDYRGALLVAAQASKTSY